MSFVELLRRGATLTLSYSPLCKVILRRLHSRNHLECINMKVMRQDMQQMMKSQEKWLRTTDKEVIMSKVPSDQSQLPTKCMADSLIRGIIPLSTDDKYRLNYLTPYDQVRFGRLLEDLDTLAVACCYKHNLNPSVPVGEFQVPRAIWTVLVDRIDVTSAFLQASVDRDIKLTGHVSWVGKSSMESTIQVTQDNTAGEEEKLLEAVFVMVARNPLINGSALVNGLEASNDAEKCIVESSEAHQRLRKAMSDESLLKTIPNELERSLIHKIFIDTLDPSTTTFKVRQKPAGTVWMDETMLKTVRICFPEQKNIYNKIFGGFLMRQAFELAWANAGVYSKNRCIAVAVDDIVFRAPVAIGSFLYLSSQVGYTDQHKMQIRVHADVKDPKTGERCTTNEFHFTLETADRSEVPVVLPKTYAESMIYLDSRRRFEEAMTYRRSQQ